MSYIFEDVNVQNIVIMNEGLVDLAAQLIIKNNVLLENFVYKNLSNFLSTSYSLNQVYSNIREYIISENVLLYLHISELLSNSSITDYDKYTLLTEEIGTKLLIGTTGALGAGALGDHYLNDGKITSKVIDYSTNAINHLKSKEEVQTQINNLTKEYNKNVDEIKKQSKGLFGRVKSIFGLNEKSQDVATNQNIQKFNQEVNKSTTNQLKMNQQEFENKLKLLHDEKIKMNQPSQKETPK